MQEKISCKQSLKAEKCFFFSSVSSSPCLNDKTEELEVLEVKMEAEKAKGQLRDDLINELRLDKLQLRQQVTQLEELLKIQMEKQEPKQETKPGSFNLKLCKNCWIRDTLLLKKWQGN